MGFLIFWCPQYPTVHDMYCGIFRIFGYTVGFFRVTFGNFRIFGYSVGFLDYKSLIRGINRKNCEFGGAGNAICSNLSKFRAKIFHGILRIFDYTVGFWGFSNILWDKNPTVSHSGCGWAGNFTVGVATHIPPPHRGVIV